MPSRRPTLKRLPTRSADPNWSRPPFSGGDPNWGRILSAAGSIGVNLPVDHVELRFEDVIVFSGGRGTEGREKLLEDIMKRDRIAVTIDLAMGSRSWRLLASDLTTEYVKINAHYHT